MTKKRNRITLSINVLKSLEENKKEEDRKKSMIVSMKVLTVLKIYPKHLITIKCRLTCLDRGCY
jgi:hypothetical protein